MDRTASDLRKYQTIGEALVCAVDRKPDYVFVVLDDGTDRTIKSYRPYDIIE